MPSRPFDEYGRIIAGGAASYAARGISLGWNQQQLDRNIGRMFGTQDIGAIERVLQDARMGITAAQYANSEYRRILLQGGDVSLANLAKGGISAFGEKLPFDAFPLLPELFGDTPEGRRAATIFEAYNPETDVTVAFYFDLTGYETWQDIIDQIVSRIESIINSDPTRFDNMSLAELGDFDITMIFAARSF